jgi:hypothetical protein
MPFHDPMKGRHCLSGEHRPPLPFVHADIQGLPAAPRPADRTWYSIAVRAWEAGLRHEFRTGPSNPIQSRKVKGKCGPSQVRKDKKLTGKKNSRAATLFLVL